MANPLVSICVATRIGPLPEIVEHGVTGWLIAPGDADAVARAVCYLLAEPRLSEKLGTATMAAAPACFHPHASMLNGQAIR